MPASIIGNPAVVTGLYQAFNGKAAGYNTYTNNLAYAAQNGPAAYAAEIGKGFYTVPAATLADTVLKNVGIDNAVLEDALVQIFTAYPVQARGQIVLNLINLLTNLESDATFGAAATAWNQLVASNNAYSNNSTNVADAVVDASTVSLTAGTDQPTATNFISTLVYTPGGTDRINSLQDEDQLIGLGDNAKLDLTLGNANDAAATMVTPKLTNIKTINVAFTGSGAATNTLDLQDATGVDAVNVTRISTGFGAIVQNITTAASQLSISNSNSPLGNGVGFTFLGSAVAGTADSTTLTLKNVNVSGIRVQEHAANAADPVNNGFETINLVSTGSTNTVGVLRAEDLQTLNIAGTQNLNLGTRGATLNGQSAEAVRYGDVFRNADGSLTKIDASAFEGNLDLTLGSVFNAGADNTSGVNVKFDLIGGKGNDTIRLTQGTVVGGTAATRDNINGGEGNNTLVLLGSSNIIQAGTAAAPVANVTNIQALEVRSGHDNEAVVAPDVITVDADAFDKLATIYVRNEGQNDTVGGVTDGVFESVTENMTVNLNNLTAAQGAAITIAHGTTGNNGIAENALVANLKSSTNASDTVGVTIVDGVNTDGRFNFSLTTNADVATTAAVERVENITLTDSDTESNTVFLASAATHTGTITLSGGRAGDFINLDTDGTSLSGLQGRNTTSAPAPVDITGWQDVGAAAGVVRLTAATINAAAELANVTVRVSTTAANTNGGQSITMGSGNDVVIFDDIAVGSATRGQAGLTNADTVAGGAGADTLVIDGHGVNVVIQQSEWDNVSGFETIYLAGNGAGNQYFLQLDNDMIVANGVNGNMITIDNDDDSTFAGNVDTRTSNTAVRLDATTLSANLHFTYDGEEGTGATADRFVVNDNNTNGGNIIDGGDQSADVLEVRNTATVTTADLANVRNVGNIVINNDQSVLQTLNLTLNDAVIDALSDAGHAAIVTETENLTIRANDGAMTDAAGTALIAAAGSRLVIDARNVSSGATGITVVGDAAFNTNDQVTIAARVAGAAHNIDLAGAGADTDTVVVTGAATTLQVALAGSLTYTTGGASLTDTLTNVEQLDLSGFAGAISAGAAGVVVPVFINTVTVTANAGGSTLTGGAGVQTFVGGVGNDTFSTGAGNDIVNLAAGGNDIVIVNSALAANADTITGFTAGAGAGADDLHFSVAGIGLNALDYAAGAVTVVNAAAAAGLGAGAWNNHIVVDTAANIAALTIGAGSATGGVLAIASDTGAILYDADGAFAAGAVLIGTVTGGGAFVAGDLAIIA
mgnify:CR=1 FL=1